MFDKHKGNKQDGRSRNDPDRFQDSTDKEKTAPYIPGKSGTIGPGINIKGDITGTENLAIEGTVQGKVELGEHEVLVGKTGRLNADVMAKSVRIEGKVEGDVVGNEKVLITRTGNVTGNIIAPRLILEDGAIFKGTVDMNPPKPAKAAAPETAVKSSVGSAGPELLKTPPGSAGKPAAKAVSVEQGKKEPGFVAKRG
jgi:cytoskeletal protein CcmA (bactofilin family)